MCRPLTQFFDSVLRHSGQYQYSAYLVVVHIALLFQKCQDILDLDRESDFGLAKISVNKTQQLKSNPLVIKVAKTRFIHKEERKKYRLGKPSSSFSWLLITKLVFCGRTWAWLTWRRSTRLPTMYPRPGRPWRSMERTTYLVSCSWRSFSLKEYDQMFRFLY